MILILLPMLNLCCSMGAKGHDEIAYIDPVLNVWQEVYVLGVDYGESTFLCKEEIYTYSTTCTESFMGIAELYMIDNVITEIHPADFMDSGVITWLRADAVLIDDAREYQTTGELSVYRIHEDGSVVTGTVSDLIFGASSLEFYGTNGYVCQAVYKEAPHTDEIRVLLKNDDEGCASFSEGYLCSDGILTVDGVTQEAGVVWNAREYLGNSGRRYADVSVADCHQKIYRCDESGRKITNGYEGTFRVWLEEDRIIYVNTVPLEDYVRYVLPSEMLSSFVDEAYKVQAVCARTYALSQMPNAQYAAYGANLDDSTMYQVYNELGESARCNEAVTETTGQVITCDNAIICCYYFSTTPGTTDGLTLWEEEDVPYLIPHNFTKADYDLTAGSNVLRFLKDPELTCYDSDSSFYRWEAKLCFDDESLEEYADEELGQLVSFKVTKRSEAGYVCGMVVQYEKGIKQLHQELQVRRFLGKYMSSLTLSNGKVRRDFTLIPCAFCAWENGEEVKVEALPEDKCITLLGGGFGHGIGMSQYGANAMACDGMDYVSIIQAYYEGVQVVDQKTIDVWK